MKARTLNQNKKLHFLFAKLGFDSDMKAAAVESVSGDRISHSSELSYAEAQELITILNQELNRIMPQQRNELAKVRQMMRRSIFRIMYDLGYIDNTMSNTEKILTIETFLKNKSKIEKPLNSLSTDELQKIIKQLQAIRRRTEEREKKQSKNI